MLTLAQTLKEQLKSERTRVVAAFEAGGKLGYAGGYGRVCAFARAWKIAPTMPASTMTFGSYSRA